MEYHYNHFTFLTIQVFYQKWYIIATSPRYFHHYYLVLLVFSFVLCKSISEARRIFSTRISRKVFWFWNFSMYLRWSLV